MNNRYNYNNKYVSNSKHKKPNNKLTWKKFWILQTIIFLLVAFVFSLPIILPTNSKMAVDALAHPMIFPLEKPSTENKIDSKIFAKEVSSEFISSNAVLIEASSGEILAYKKCDEKVYPASLTKVMTAIIAVEHYSDFSENLKVPFDIFSYLIEQNASVAGFEPYETVPVIDLLYGVLLPSGADACLTFADSISGSESQFAKLMTEKAHEIGAVNTNFVNSTGLHSPNHYSTVNDIAIIMQYALKNPTLKKIMSTSTYTTTSTKYHRSGITLESTVTKAVNRTGKDRGPIIGGKTGFTDEARLCLATFSKIGTKEYIFVSVGAGDEYSSKKTYHVEDAWLAYSSYTK